MSIKLEGISAASLISTLKEGKFWLRFIGKPMLSSKRTRR